MKNCTAQEESNKFANLNIFKQNYAATVKRDKMTNSDFMFPLNFPLKNLDNLSWDKIDKIGHSGKARILFALGATKKDYMKNGFVAEYQIIGFDHDDLADGSGKAPISWDMLGLYKDAILMKKNSESSCWDTSDGRKHLNIDFFENTSDELRRIIKPVWKLTADASNTGKIIKSKDSIWLKSEKEQYGRCFYSFDGEGCWYELYAQENVQYFKLKQDGTKDWNWLRSVICGDARGFCIVNTGGSVYINISGRYYGFAPAFCS